MLDAGVNAVVHSRADG